jgi:hypothetical protein
MAAEVYLVYLEFSRANRDSLDEVRGLIHNHFPHCLLRTVIVDNSIELRNIEIRVDEHTDLIYGNNRSRDISGLDVGFQYLLKRYTPTAKSIVYIANDTFRKSTNAVAIRKVSGLTIADGIKKGYVLGYMDRFPKSVRVLDRQVPYWIRSNFIVLPFNVLKSILPLEVPLTDGQIFSDAPKAFFKKNAPLSENYQRYLRTWLFGEKDPRGEMKGIWHSSQPITKRNFESMKTKTRAILSEHFISARLIGKHPIIPLNHGWNSAQSQ